eukprot:3140017-Rhodomonas_salina.1
MEESTRSILSCDARARGRWKRCAHRPCSRSTARCNDAAWSRTGPSRCGPANPRAHPHTRGRKEAREERARRGERRGVRGGDSREGIGNERGSRGGRRGQGEESGEWRVESGKA